MTFGQAVLLGLVKGITEFLPVSSLGHLAVFRQLFHMQSETKGLYGAMLSMGALISICLVFYKEVWKIILEALGIFRDILVNSRRYFKNRSIQTEKIPYIKVVRTAYRRWIVMIIVSMIPTIIIGYCGKDVFEVAGKGLLIPGICFLVTAVILLLCDVSNAGRKTPKEIKYIHAFSIGMVQGIAMIPGLSRVGIVMTAGVLYGFDKKFALKNSFILFIPLLVGDIIRSLLSTDSFTGVSGELAGYAAGMVIAIIAGYICLKITILMVRSNKLKLCSIYCLAMGILSIYGHFYIV